jgi:glycerophosphoryl diester phosphodiesterase
MAAPPWLEKIVLGSLDAIYATIPTPLPDPERLLSARVIAHRGAHRLATENTFAAFRAAAQNDCWGIEFDLRWTRDEWPVVHHDQSCRRIFGSDQMIAQCTREELRILHPEIPWLEEMIAEFGKKIHLMIELKDRLRAEETTKIARLRDLLSELTPLQDYHVISLDPSSLLQLTFIPRETCIPIASTNARAVQQQIEKYHWGGLLAPYSLCPTDVVTRELAAGRQMGTGFVDSENVLKRELNRGVTWLFSNNPVVMNRVLNRLRSARRTPPLAYQVRHQKCHYDCR